MWKYYKDVTLYALAICSFIAMASSATYTSVASGVLNTLVIFGVFGTGLGVLAYNYFQKQQYYFYHNLGFTKRELIVKTWLVNLVIAAVLILCTSFFL
jgi:hypothetical protein